MKDPKDNEVKVYFSSADFREFKRLCAMKKVKHSKHLRNLGLESIQQHQFSATTTQENRPNFGRNFLLPVANSRWNFGGAPVRPRI